MYVCMYVDVVVPVMLTYSYTSFIPRASPPPVFDHFQYANTERGRPGESCHKQ